MTQSMKMTRRAMVAAAVLAVTAMPAAAQWKPTKPITIIVPWAAGGATDQVTRLAAAEIEEGLGQKIVVVNQPGGAGSIGTKNALDAPRDGYTWTAGAPKQVGTYPLLGMINSKLDDFHLFLSVTLVSVVSVNPNSPYQTMPQLLDAMKAKPGQVTVATAGNTSSGHFGMEAISQATGLKYRHVTYDGGNPAVISTVSGETEVTTQLSTEQSEMIKAQAPAAAGSGCRPAADDRRAGHDPGHHAMGAEPAEGDDGVRFADPQGRTAGDRRDGREDLDGEAGELREVQDLRGAAWRAVHAGRGQDGA